VRRAGNKSRVARDLGLSRQGLAKKMRRYGLGFDLTADADPAAAVFACDRRTAPPAAPAAAAAAAGGGGVLASGGAIS
jgi:hypothetical protein